MNTNLNKNVYCQKNSTVAGAIGTACQKVISQIAQAKRRLIREFSEQLAGHESLLRLALNEAEALAWETDYPHLVFATLALEKVQAAATWETRQQLFNRRNLVLAPVAGTFAH